MRWWWVLLPVLILPGCEEFTVKDAAACRADGFVDGSPDFQDCLENHDQQRRIAREHNADEQAQDASSVASLMFVRR